MNSLNIFGPLNVVYLNTIVLLLISLFTVYDPGIPPQDLILLEFVSLVVYLFIPLRQEKVSLAGRVAMGAAFVVIFGLSIWYELAGWSSFIYFTASTLAKFANGVTEEEKTRKVALLIGFFIIGFLLAFFLSMFGLLNQAGDETYTAIWALIYFVILFGGSIYSSLNQTG